ncbi:thiamine monophosphate synthase [Candidatus Tenderia electrophaga]|jgi:8-oxo-dGTP diphosphatase|uniref:8-oxo-dGTP diphosphatase n=1 Tax=Candidatus Tenderia electrophaga TaxID=1748243 RepID=A0A0S2T9I2_9GAMM|nr:thiamine monophosphate synthase [Candidatus Tenderia electrophaga]
MDYIHVAAALICNDQGQVLIAKRPAHKHQGGLWEFPGGKVEAGEDVLAALTRELDEEVGIQVGRARPLIRVKHAYPDRSVLLDVWRVDGFRGTPHGREGQPLAWCHVDELSRWDFPAANRPIIAAAQLPDCYLITPEPDAVDAFLAQLQQALAQGIRLLQLRAKGLAAEAYKALAQQVVPLCHAHGARVLLNGEPDWVAEVGADGIQLSSGRLHSLSQRPLDKSLLVAASCHSREELHKALQLEADFALLSPIKWTQSHPDTEPLGWDEMRRLVDEMPIPVYALGGVSRDDLAQAFAAGGQGIAAIRSLWPAG